MRERSRRESSEKECVAGVHLLGIRSRTQITERVLSRVKIVEEGLGVQTRELSTASYR